MKFQAVVTEPDLAAIAVVTLGCAGPVPLEPGAAASEQRCAREGQIGSHVQVTRCRTVEQAESDARIVREAEEAISRNRARPTGRVPGS